MQQNYRAERALGYQQITSLSSAQSLTIPAGTALAIIKPTAQDVRWRDDGTNPTSTVGYPLAAGDELQYSGQALTELRFIEQAAGAVLNICYYGGSHA